MSARIGMGDLPEAGGATTAYPLSTPSSHVEVEKP